MFRNCASFRGPTQCSAGACFCEEGHCSTVQGECVQQQNRKVASKVIFRNARYPKHVMHMSTYNRDLWVSSQSTDQSEFNLFQLPGDEGFLLGSEKWSTEVATIDEQMECDNNQNSRHIGANSCRIRIEARAIAIERLTSSSAETLAVNILAAPEYEGQPTGVQSVMIESYKYPRRFMTVNRLSWDVGAGRNDQGAGSYWIPEPPLKIKLKAYKGPRCSFDCGSYGSMAFKSACCHCMCLLVCLGCWLANALPT